MQIPIGENWYRNRVSAPVRSPAIDEPCIEDGGYVKLRELSLAYTLRPAVGQSCRSA